MYYYDDPESDSEFTQDDEEKLDQLNQPEPVEPTQPTERECDVCPGLPIVG